MHCLQYKLMNIFIIKINLKIDATKNIIFWGISQVKSKSEIHSPGNFLLGGSSENFPNNRHMFYILG